ncbi:MAG: toll/interleukin-1 receptor domain-containing protein [Candidatus Doudnabacteria bacterium]|nr:toll/interleukin-1 receptor domain-containing protein [Candidatus Doudnabacteria bacterium]
MKDRRYFLVSNLIKERLMNSEKDIGVAINVEKEFMKPLERQDVTPPLTSEEITYTVRHLVGKGSLAPFQRQYEGSLEEVKLTKSGFDKWLFPTGEIDSRKIFLSHATEDKDIAIKIKKGLEPDFSVFVAHEDMEPTSLWRDRLISELETCGVFIALRTENYPNKSYTEQECGWALAFDKRILTLCIGTDPEESGFCSAIQAKKFAGNVGVKEIISYCKKQLGA